MIIVCLNPLKSMGISAESAIVMEVKTGRILYSRNINIKKPMASTTKIMTALIALENSTLDTMIKIPNEAVGIEGSSIYLRNNEKMSLEDMLYGLMLRSGNDVATAIAYYIGGTEEKFAEMMNQRAKEIGANNTNFVNPHGLSHSNHYTTAYDLALITRKALLNKNFKRIVSTKSWKAQREGYNYFYNKNKTLSQLSGGDGVKTGYTKAAGRCLVTSATRDGMQILAVVLNAPNWFEDSYLLINEAFNKYKPHKVLSKEKPIKAYYIHNGKKEKSYLIPKENIILPLTEEEKNKIITVFEGAESQEAPILKGSVLGKAKIYLGDRLLGTTELLSIEDIEKQRIIDYIIDFFKK